MDHSVVKEGVYRASTSFDELVDGEGFMLVIAREAL